jgi:hypothetical protein
MNREDRCANKFVIDKIIIPIIEQKSVAVVARQVLGL